MTIRIGLNGFGRIGRSLFRAALNDPLFQDLEVVAINDPAPREILAHLLKYDSVMGILPQSVEETPDGLRVDGREVAMTRETEPGRIPWRDRDVEFVLECSGRFANRDACEGHLRGGASRVVISAPAKGEVKTFVMGVNEDDYDPREHHIVSNASCTTNCLAPMANVILETFGIKRGMMTTVHAYTGDQRLIDAPHKDFRRARSAGLSMVPTSTGAAAAIGLVIPALKGRFDGLSVRVPTANVSLVDAVMEVEREANADEVNDALRQAADGRVLGFTDLPLVSIDFQGDPRSSIIDGSATRAIGTQVKVLTWYDNEWGYANRLLDLILHMKRAEG